MKQKIILVSHCFLNDASKLKNQDKTQFENERRLKRTILKQMLSREVEIIQLPCPEQLLYGCNRWGHAASQFDTLHFRKETRRMLEPIVTLLMEYSQNPDRFQILGILGINGSPSCGVHYTYDGKWGGSIEHNEKLPGILDSLEKVNKAGIFMEEFKNMLLKEELQIPFYSLERFEVDRILNEEGEYL